MPMTRCVTKNASTSSRFCGRREARSWAPQEPRPGWGSNAPPCNTRCNTWEFLARIIWVKNHLLSSLSSRAHFCAGNAEPALSVTDVSQATTFRLAPSARILEYVVYPMAPDIAPPQAQSEQLDDAALEAALRRHLRGEVRFDAGSRALYATDGSNYRQVPIGVVVPRDKEDVLATIAICRDHQAPLLARGGGTSLAGQCCNAAIVLDFSKYMARILEIDPRRRIARVEPGVVLDTLRAAAEKHHLTFAPDPATHDRCTLGGMIGNNSCGVHSIMAGKTDDNIEALEILTYGGQRMKVGATSTAELESIVQAGGRRAEIYAGLKSIADKHGEQVRRQFPNIPRRVSGYNLNHLLPENGFHVARPLAGSEGTCVPIPKASCRLVESPPERVLLVLAYADIFQCADRVPEIMAHGPIGLEGVDHLLVEYTRRKAVNS